MTDPTAADRDENHLHPDLRMKWLRLAESCISMGFPIFLTEGMRSARRQEWLYAQGRTRPGRVVTHARAGQSWHETGRACDFAFRDNTNPWAETHPWKTVGHMAEALGLEWGGDWSPERVDKPHLQLTEGLTIQQALAQLKET